MNKEVTIETVDVPNIDLLRQEEVEACSILDDVVFARYLHRLKDFQLEPVNEDFEKNIKNIRLFKIDEMVYQKNENAVHKFATVFSSLANYDCSVFVIIDSDGIKSDFYLGIKTNNEKKITPTSVGDVLTNVLKGQFPGVKTENLLKSPIENLVNNFPKSNLAIVSCVAETKDRELKNNEQYIQGLEKFALAMQGKRYTAIILANSVAKNEIQSERKTYEDLYTKLSAFNSTQVSYGRNDAINFTEALSRGSSNSVTKTLSDSKSSGTTKSNGSTYSVGNSESDSVSNAKTKDGVLGRIMNLVTFGIRRNTTETHSKGISKSFSHSSNVVDGKTETITKGSSTAKTEQISEQKTVTRGGVIGKNDNIQLIVQNRTLKGFLDKIDLQLKRLDECESLGMWNCATYFMADEMETVQMAATTYQALMKGEVTATETSAINYWNSKDVNFSEVRESVLNFYHPIFKNNSSSYNEFPVLPIIPVSSYELAIHMGMPRKSVCGLPVVEHAEFGKEIVHYSNLENSNKICLGSIYNMGQEDINHKCCLDFKSLASHVFVTGSTGSGKSNTIYQILKQARNNNVKFLVIEPAKGEYKDIFGGDENVHVYGTNEKLMTLLKINPFSFDSTQIHVYEHMDRLVEIFNVCWPMYAAMPAVLKNAIEKSYEDCGWNLVKSENKYDNDYWPTFADVAKNVKQIMESSEYDAENKGAYKGALLTRLNSLTNGINGEIFVNDGVPAADLFNENVIIDLSRVGSMETKSLIMGMLILKLEEYRMANKNGSNVELQHITVIEEAHNLLKKTSTGLATENGNLLGKSVEMLSNAIAEMRTYGEGFVIVDQAPGLLDMSAIRNTNTKIIMRLPDQGDRELAGYAANLTDDQIKELAKLPCGVAAVYQNEWLEPVLCKVAEYENKEKKKFSYKEGTSSSEKDMANQKLKIVEMLSLGVKIEDDKMREFSEKLNELELSASTKVSIIKMVKNPSKEPRMTKIAPIVATLFSSINDCMRDTYLVSKEPVDWTNAVEESLKKELNNVEISDLVRRDIVQGVITYYLLNCVNDMDSLKEWHLKGGLQ